MLTIKKLNKFEKHTFKSIKGIITDYPILCAYALVFIGVITLFAITMMLMGAAIGYSQFEMISRTDYAVGNITMSEYKFRLLALDVAVTCYNYIVFLMKLFIYGFFAIFLYTVYKNYLRYKHDYL